MARGLRTLWNLALGLTPGVDAVTPQWSMIELDDWIFVVELGDHEEMVRQWSCDSSQSVRTCASGSRVSTTEACDVPSRLVHRLSRLARGGL